MTKEQRRKLEDARFNCEHRELVARTMKAQVEWYRATIEVERLKLELAQLETEKKEFVESLEPASAKSVPSPVSAVKYTEEDLRKSEKAYTDWTAKGEKMNRQLYAAQQEYGAARGQAKQTKDKTLKGLLTEKAEGLLANIMALQKEIDAIKLARRVEWTRITEIRHELGLPAIQKMS